MRILNSAKEKKKERKTLFHTMEFQTAVNRFLRQNFADQETVGWYIQSAKWKNKQTNKKNSLPTKNTLLGKSVLQNERKPFKTNRGKRVNHH